MSIPKHRSEKPVSWFQHSTVRYFVMYHRVFTVAPSVEAFTNAFGRDLLFSLSSGSTVLVVSKDLIICMFCVWCFLFLCVVANKKWFCRFCALNYVTIYVSIRLFNKHIIIIIVIVNARLIVIFLTICCITNAGFIQTKINCYKSNICLLAITW